MATIADIQTFTRFLCDADTTSYTAANLLITTNQAYEEVVAKILDADGRWQWDDTNRTDLPIGTTTLVNGQQDYAFDTTHLKILGVSVKDKDGVYVKLQPVDSDDMGDVDRSQFYSTSGLPGYYDKIGNSVFLYPAPDNGVSVTLSAGLKVYFQRTADVYTSAQVTTGTKVPGFASPFHMLLAYKAALPYCMNYKKHRVPGIVNEIAKLEKDLVKFYSKRDKEERAVMTPKRVLYI